MKTKIEEGIKNAMKSKDTVRLRTLRALKTQMVNEEKSSSFKGVLDELLILTKAVKQQKDSIDIYSKVGRLDLVQIKQEELLILEEFLPKQLTEDEVKNKIIEIIGIWGNNLGLVIKHANQELRGQTDGKLIANLAKSLI